MHRLVPFLMALLGAVLLSGTVLAQEHLALVREDLETFETTHFRVIYQKPLASSAPVFAEHCEDAYAKLSALFDWVPEGKIDAYYIDALDAHNGWATSVPHKLLVVAAAGVEPPSTIYQPANYLRRTVFHELTHVFAMDMSAGWNRKLAKVFGRVLPVDLISSTLFLFTSPRAVLAPRWLLEGVAVWAETEYVPPGRGKSTYVDMIFRCAVQEGRLLGPEKWYPELPDWPYGNVTYLYGMRYFQHLVETSNAQNPVGDMMQGIAHSYPFDFDEAAGKVTGLSRRAFARQVMQREKTVQRENLARLETLPTTEVPRLTPERLLVYSPIHAGGKVYFLGNEEEARNRIYAFDPETGEFEPLPSGQVTAAFGNLTASPDGRYLYYVRLDVQKWENVWYELRRYDVVTGRNVAVTREGRYRHIHLSADGSHLVAVSQRGALYSLWELEIGAEGDLVTTTELRTLPVGQGMFSPRYSPDGTRVAYVRTEGELFSLEILDLKTEQVSVVHVAEHQILMPTWHPTEERLVFSSDANGVFNLYEVRPGSSDGPTPLTHVTGGLFFPDYSADGSTLVATSFDGGGPHLTELGYDPETLVGESLPSVSAQWVEWRSAEADAGEPEREGVDRATLSEAYNSFTSIRPNFWSPWIQQSARGAYLGAFGHLSDPTGYQEVFGLVGRETYVGTNVGALHYIYRGLGPNLHAYGAREQGYYPDLIVDQDRPGRHDYAEVTDRVGFALSMPFYRLERSLVVQAGYEYKTRDPINRIYDPAAPPHESATAPTAADESLIWAQLVYFDGTAFRRSFSVEDGRLISFGMERSGGWLGGSLERLRYLGKWNEYLKTPWGKNHVLKLTGSFGDSSGDQVAQGAFTLGGVGNTTSDITLGVPRSVGLRGYPTNFQVGDGVTKAGVAYRVPILPMEQGFEGAVPIYLSRLFGEVFYEGGRTFAEPGGGDDLGWINSLGVEANFQMRPLRYFGMSPGLGVAYVPQADDRDPRLSEVTVYLSFRAWISF